MLWNSWDVATHWRNQLDRCLMTHDLASCTRASQSRPWCVGTRVDTRMSTFGPSRGRQCQYVRRRGACPSSGKPHGNLRLAGFQATHKDGRTADSWELAVLKDADAPHPMSAVCAYYRMTCFAASSLRKDVADLCTVWLQRGQRQADAVRFRGESQVNRGRRCGSPYKPALRELL